MNPASLQMVGDDYWFLVLFWLVPMLLGALLTIILQKCAGWMGTSSTTALKEVNHTETEGCPSNVSLKVDIDMGEALTCSGTVLRQRVTQKNSDVKPQVMPATISDYVYYSSTGDCIHCSPICGLKNPLKLRMCRKCFK